MSSLKGIKSYFICMKMKLMKKKKIFAAKILTKGTWTPNYSWVYVEGQLELSTFYMVMDFVPILHYRCRSKTDFLCF